MKDLQPMNILVPIDFTPPSENALAYSVELAKFVGANIHVVHVVPPDRALSSDDQNGLSKDYLLNKIIEAKSCIERDSKIACSYDVLKGSVSEQIINACVQQKADLIVMSSKVNTRLESMIFGSTTVSVIEQAKPPVLVLPADFKFLKPLRIVFATDYHSSDIRDLEELTRIAKPFNASIHVVHVANRFRNEDDDEIIDAPLQKHFSDQVRQRIPYTKIHCEEYQFTDIPNGIKSYADEEQADLVAMSIRQRGFLERIFSRSVTRQIMFDFNLPLLVFHTNGSKKINDLIDNHENH